MDSGGETARLRDLNAWDPEISQRNPARTMASRDDEEKANRLAESSARKPVRDEQGNRERLIPRAVPRSPDIERVAEQFLAQARAEKKMLPVSAFTVYQTLAQRAEVSGITRLSDPDTGKPLTWAKTGKLMWPDVLSYMAGLYFDNEYTPGNLWAWKQFSSEKTFMRLLEYVLWQLVDHAARAADARTSEELADERRSYERDLAARAAARTVTAPPEPAPLRRPVTDKAARAALASQVDAEVFGDDEEEWQEIRAARRKARKALLKSRRTRTLRASKKSRREERGESE